MAAGFGGTGGRGCEIADPPQKPHATSHGAGADAAKLVAHGADGVAGVGRAAFGGTAGRGCEIADPPQKPHATSHGAGGEPGHDGNAGFDKSRSEPIQLPARCDGLAMSMRRDGGNGGWRMAGSGTHRVKRLVAGSMPASGSLAPPEPATRRLTQGQRSSPGAPWWGHGPVPRMGGNRGQSRRGRNAIPPALRYRGLALRAPDRTYTCPEPPAHLKGTRPMPAITLPDSSVRRFDAPVTGATVAAAIGPGLARAALAMKLDGKLVDLDTSIDHDAAGRLRHPPRRRRVGAHPPRRRPCPGRGRPGAVSRNPGHHRPGDRRRLLLRLRPQPAVHPGRLPRHRGEDAGDHRRRRQVRAPGDRPRGSHPVLQGQGREVQGRADPGPAAQRGHHPVPPGRLDRPAAAARTCAPPPTSAPRSS